MWIKGRQGTGYDKLPIIVTRFFDLYLLRFPQGCHVPPHVDGVDAGFAHYRMNIVLKKAKDGGEFVTNGSIINWSRLKLFRPDICEHSVTRVNMGTRYLLSIGWLRKI